MLIHSAPQLLTLTPQPQRGHELGTLNLLQDAAILIRDGKIAAIGSSHQLLAAYPNEPQFNASKHAILPGFVDPHTHAIWAGDRAAEFEMRLQGKTYLEILQAGGGILSTMRATRAASLQQLIQETRPRLQSMFRHGATTIEVKTGYGLETETERKMLAALLHLHREGPWELAFTYLAAHAIPPEYTAAPDAYTQKICEEMLPDLREWWNALAPQEPLPFVDVFCETGAFTLEQSRRILQAARELGFPLKIHADEFDNLGGAALAAQLGAASADHLVATSQADIETLAASSTVAVALPCTPFGLAESHYTPAKQIIAANGYLALATDLNPGTAWCENMQFPLALACRYMKLTPAQAIVAATINAAAAIGRAESIGSLQVGKQADLLLLTEPNYQHLGYRFGGNLVHTVVKKGVFYTNGDYDHA
ncbi:MAG: imidazolonepropionase [Anaerolineales bacterium]